MSDEPSFPWVVYEANGGADGVGDRVYGPVSRARALQLVDQINQHPQVAGRGWAMALLRPVLAPAAAPARDPPA